MKLDIPVIGILRGILPDFFAEVMTAAVGVGTSLFGQKALADRKPREIVRNVRQFLSLIHQ